MQEQRVRSRRLSFAKIKTKILNSPLPKARLRGDRKKAAYWHLREACPVSMRPSAEVALIVTGFPTAAVQVAMTSAVGSAEKWTEGSLAVQFALTSADALPVQTPLPVSRPVELKVPVLAEVWSRVMVGGATFNAVTVQLLFIVPPHPTVTTSAAESTNKNNIFDGIMSICPFLLFDSTALKSSPVKNAGNT
jgi:hypothetical protein